MTFDSDTLESLLGRHSPKDLPTLYVSGPMTGVEDFNFPTFNAFARKMRFLGFPVLNPADYGLKPNLHWEQLLARDLHCIAHCDLIVLQDGWERSRGAKLERHVGIELGKVALTSKEFTERVLLHYWTDEELEHKAILDSFRQECHLADGPDGMGIALPFLAPDSLTLFDPEDDECL